MSMILAPPSHCGSCVTCATAKRRYDLRLPQCSRCLTRATDCSYSNEPLSSPSLTTPMNPPATQLSGAHNGDSRAYLVTNVRSYPAMFVFRGRTPFIHSRLYHDALPKMMQNAFAICALNLTMTDTNKLAVFHIMEAKVAELIHKSNEATWPIAENLAGVQALILVHIIQLFDGDIRQRALAEQNEVILVD